MKAQPPRPILLAAMALFLGIWVAGGGIDAAAQVLKGTVQQNETPPPPKGDEFHSQSPTRLNGFVFAPERCAEDKARLAYKGNLPAGWGPPQLVSVDEVFRHPSEYWAFHKNYECEPGVALVYRNLDYGKRPPPGWPGWYPPANVCENPGSTVPCTPPYVAPVKGGVDVCNDPNAWRIPQCRTPPTRAARDIQQPLQARPGDCSTFSSSQQNQLRKTGIEWLDTAAAMGQQGDRMLQAFGDTLAGAIATLADPQAFTAQQRGNIETMSRLMALPNPQFNKVLQGAAQQQFDQFMRDPATALGTAAAGQVLSLGVAKVASTVCQATAVTAGKTVQAAKAASDRLRTMVRRFAPALPPIQRGMPLADDYAFRWLARTHRWTIVVRNSNPAAIRWIGHPDALPKPPDLKIKTIPYDPSKPFSEQPYAGLVSGKGLPQKTLDDLRAKGYVPDPARDDILVKDGKFFYSDTDLGGVYDAYGNNVWPQMKDQLEKGLIRDLNTKFVDDAIQHGPHDVFPGRNIPTSPAYGPQVGNGKSLTAYLFDGSACNISSLQEMRAFYASRGIDFANIYPEFAVH